MISNKGATREKTILAKTSIEVKKIIKIGKKDLGNKIVTEIKKETSSKIRKINILLETEIPDIQDKWTEEWIDNLKGWLRIIDKRRREEWEKIKRKEIQENIDKRCERIKSEQGKC